MNDLNIQKPKKLNSNLTTAKQVKNDEFYTQLTDIEKEVKNYKEHFKNKIVYCNCDDPEWSNFFKYFTNAFDFLGLKKVITTHYRKNGNQSYKLELTNNGEVIKSNLKGDGDFRSEECIEILKERDIVITNPPFSLFREYISQLMEYKKQFLIIGSVNAITYKETFKFIKENKLWLGISPRSMNFKLPDETLKCVNATWFTNLTHKKRNEEIILFKSYNENINDYPKYDNYDAINIDKVKEIPIDYNGFMGVPITFLEKYNPNQFEIINSNNIRLNDFIPFKEHGLIKDKEGTINGKAKYVRILIKNKNPLSPKN